jgi:hypothetical protein
VHEQFITITGKADRIDTLTMQGAPVAVTEEGAFSEPYLLTPGVNRIVFKATDKYGHSSTDVLQIVYQPATSTTPVATTTVATSTASNNASSETTYTDTALNIRFVVPSDWSKRTQSESGYPEFVSPDFSHVNLNDPLKGAYLAYNVYAVPDGYKDRPDSYLAALKKDSGWLGDERWQTISVGGYAMFEQHQPDGRIALVGQAGDTFVDISFRDSTGTYLPVYQRFIATLSFLSQ